MKTSHWVGVLAVVSTFALPLPVTALAKTIAPDLTRITDATVWTVHHATAEVRGAKGRPLGLFVDSAEGLYANLRVTPTS